MWKQLLNFLTGIFLLIIFTSCSVGMAMSGKPSPNLGAFHVGSTRGEVELQLGGPQKTVTNPDGTRTDIYVYEVGNEPSAGRAAGHAVMDLLTLGIWEIVGTPIEASQGDEFSLMIRYGRNDKVVSINSVASPPKPEMAEDFDEDEDEFAGMGGEEEIIARATPFNPRREEAVVDVGGSLGTKIEDLAQQLSTGLEEHHIKRIAVFPLYDIAHEVNRPLGNYLTEKLTTMLYKIGSAKVLERSQLDKVIEEVHLTKGGRFDDASVQQIGKLLGVDAVIVGSYTELGNHTVEVNSRIVNVETGEIVGIGTINIPSGSVAPLLRGKEKRTRSNRNVAM